MKAGSRMLKWAIAIALLAGFFLSFFMEITGLVWHQWLGLGVGMLALYHGWIHRAWVVSMVRSKPGSGAGQGQTLFVVDSLLLIGIAVHVTSGLLISTWLGWSLKAGSAWTDLHVYASLVTLGLVVIKVGLHWRWIVAATKARVASSWHWLAGGEAEAAPRGVAAPGRREFLGLMGLVGLAAVLASARSLRAVLEPLEAEAAGGLASGGSGSSGEAADGAGVAAASPSSSGDVATAAGVSPSDAGSASGCTLQCGNRCSFPGRCRRYSDADGNGLCDLGECI